MSELPIKRFRKMSIRDEAPRKRSKDDMTVSDTEKPWDESAEVALEDATMEDAGLTDAGLKENDRSTSKL